MNGEQVDVSLPIGCASPIFFRPWSSRALDDARSRCDRLANGRDAPRANGPAAFFLGTIPYCASIDDSFRGTLAILELTSPTRNYLFGDRPSFGDCAMWGPLSNVWTDPIPGAFINAFPARYLAWIHPTSGLRADGTSSRVEPRTKIDAILQRQFGRPRMPWTFANAAAIASGSDEFSVVHGRRICNFRSRAGITPNR